MTGWGRWGGPDRRRIELVGGRYRLIEELGEGGMSVVWRGQDEVLGRPVAVKMLAPRLSSDPTFRRQMRIEARAAARLSHPHITGVYDYGEAVRFGRTVPYVVMELVDGEPLAARLDRDGRLPWWDAVVLAAQVAAALAAAHARGVVHRDITPGNVMVTGLGAKVVDFGISALVGERDGTADGQLFGTPAYLAPERLGQGQVSPATDVYALGLLLYRMLTGQLPWRTATRTQMLRAHLYTEPAPMPSVPGLPPGVVEIVDRCLAKDPAGRPDSAELARVLAAAAGVVVPVPATSVPVAPVAPDRPAGDAETVAGDAATVAGDAATVVVGGHGGVGGLPGRLIGSVDPGTTILPSSEPTGELRAPAGRRGRPTGWTGPARAGRGLRVAAVGVGLLAVSGGVWAVAGGVGGPDGSVVPASAGGRLDQGGPAPGGPASCRVDYLLRADDDRRFDVDLKVTNLGFKPLRDWSLTFVFPGDQALLGASSPDSRQEGREVRLRPLPGGPESTLSAGGTARFSLRATYAGANPVPVEFRLNDTPCLVQISPGSGDSGGIAAGAEAGMLPPLSSPGVDQHGSGSGSGADGRGGSGSGTPKGPDKPKDPDKPKGPEKPKGPGGSGGPDGSTGPHRERGAGPGHTGS